MTYGHYTVRARQGRYPFLDEALARWVWRRLEASFPEALGAILMPNHLHLVAPDEGKRSLRRLSALMGASGRALGEAEGRGALWQPVAAPAPIESPDKLRRNVRYVWLNCCRPWRYRGRWIQLVDDPLAWRWSTLHDSIGGILEPWVPAERVARALEWPTGSTTEEHLHRYATSDDHVSAAARIFPSRPEPSAVPDRALGDVFEAALAATRLPREALRHRTPARHIAVGLAYRQGWRQAKGLSTMFGLHPTTVSKIAARVPAARVETAALCLDPRMLRCAMAAAVDALA